MRLGDSVGPEVPRLTTGSAPRQGSWTRAEVEAVSKGVGAARYRCRQHRCRGIIVFTDWTVDDLAWFIGALLVFRGTFTLFSVPVDASARSWSIGHGLIELMVGIAVWVWPAPTLLVIAAFIGRLLLFRGTMAIAGSINARRVMPCWGLIVAGGIAEAAVAFCPLSRPALTPWPPS